MNIVHPDLTRIMFVNAIVDIHILERTITKYMAQVNVQPRVVVNKRGVNDGGTYWVGLYFDDEADRIMLNLNKSTIHRHFRIFHYYEA